jgi:hypothetical protein
VPANVQSGAVLTASISIRPMRPDDPATAMRSGAALTRSTSSLHAVPHATEGAPS